MSEGDPEEPVWDGDHDHDVPEPKEAPKPPEIDEDENKDEGNEDEVADEEPDEDSVDETKIEKEPKGRGLAKTAFFLGLGVIGVSIVYILIDLLEVFLNNFFLMGCLTGAGLCLLGLIGFFLMVGAIVLGIIALVQGAGDKKKMAIIGMIMGICYVPLMIFSAILTTVLEIIF